MVRNPISSRLLNVEFHVYNRLVPASQAARQLLTLDVKDPKRLFEGPALLRRMTRFGLLGEDEKELDFVLQLTTEKLLERRLQTKVSMRSNRGQLCGDRRCQFFR